MADAAITLTAAALTPIFQKLADKAASRFGGDVTGEEINVLRSIILPKIQTVVGAADGVDAAQLRPWLMKLKAAAHEAEDVLDEYEYKAMAAVSSPKLMRKAEAMAKEFFSPVLLKTSLRRSLEKLRRSAAEADQLIPLIGIAPQRRRNISDCNNSSTATTVSTLSSPVFGRDEERDAVVGALISPQQNENDPVVALCGIGGAGKTTLAQYVYDDARVRRHFDVRVWIHVSQAFDEHRITREIIESVMDAGFPPIGSLDVLQRKLKLLLDSKRFLLVLDDVWLDDRRRWDQMIAPLKLAGEVVGSKILVTSRTRHVLSKLGVKSENVHYIKELKSGDCWSILKHYANRPVIDRDLEDVGDRIVSRTRNSPLAARIVGSALAEKTSADQWKAFLKHDVLKDTMDLLYLSFQSLPHVLQCCFAYCSLYPKGFEFSDEDVDELVRMWVSQGFVGAPATGRAAIEGRGRECFDQLACHSFFELRQTGRNARVHVVHDLLHDLAEKVSEGFCFRIDGEVDVGRTATIPDTVVHLSIATRSPTIPLPDILKLKDLRTFMVIFSPQTAFDGILKEMKRLFESLTKLRVLHFGGKMVPELNGSIDKLRHLRYLQLAGVHRLPESMKKLYHLQFFLLPARFVDVVPKSMASCVRLTGDKYCEKIKSTWGTSGTYVYVSEVYDVRRDRQYGVELFEDRPRTANLQVAGLENVVLDVAQGARFQPMSTERLDVESLTLDWATNPMLKRRFGRESLNSEQGEDRVAIDENMIEGFEPSTNLKELSIVGYRGARLPLWMAACRHLRCLKLCRLPAITLLVFGPHFEALSSLFIEDLEGLMSMEGVESLPSLQRLEIRQCRRLAQLLPSPGGPSSVARLQEVKVLCCPMLRTGGCLPLIEQRLTVDDCLLLPPLLGELQVPKSLTFQRCHDDSLTFSPANTQNLSSLKNLRLLECRSVESLPELPPSLETLTCEQCDRLTSPLENLEALSSLRELEFDGCPELELPGDLNRLSSLRELRIRRCPKLRLLPDMPASLRSLAVGYCKNLTFLSGNLKELPSLTSLEMLDCPNVKPIYSEDGKLHPNIRLISNINLV